MHQQQYPLRFGIVPACEDSAQGPLAAYKAALAGAMAMAGGEGEGWDKEQPAGALDVCRLFAQVRRQSRLSFPSTSLSSPSHFSLPNILHSSRTPLSPTSLPPSGPRAPRRRRRVGLSLRHRRSRLRHHPAQPAAALARYGRPLSVSLARPLSVSATTQRSQPPPSRATVRDLHAHPTFRHYQCPYLGPRPGPHPGPHPGPYLGPLRPLSDRVSSLSVHSPSRW